MEINEALHALNHAGLIAEKFSVNDVIREWNEENIKKVANAIKRRTKLTNLGIANVVALGKLVDKNMMWFVVHKLHDEAELILKKARELSPKSFQTDDDTPDDVQDDENDLPSNEERAEDDGGYMGSYYEHYGLDDPCTDEEWAAAGKQWAQDMLDNGEYTDDEYEDAISYYDSYYYEG
jgi:hypothetical protein